jgi:hypothetical protein
MKKNYTSMLSLWWTAIIVLFTGTLQSQIIANGTYKILSSVHNEVMTCATTAPHDANMAAPVATDNFQLWVFTHQGNDVYKIVNQGNGLTLGINDGWCGNFGDAKANFENTAENVAFKIIPGNDAGKVVIQIGFTTCNFGSVNNPIKAFDIQDGASGAQIQTFETFTTSPNQQFQIVTPAFLSTLTSNANVGLNVFYNPNSGLNITHNQKDLGALSIKIFDMTGKLIKIENFKSSQNTSVTVNMDAFAKGIYAVQITENEVVQKTQKIAIY